MIIRFFLTILLLTSFPIPGTTEDPITISKVTPINEKELLIKSSPPLSIASVEYQFSKQEIIFNFKESFILEETLKAKEFDFNPNKSQLTLYYSGKNLPQFTIENTIQGLTIALTQAIFSQDNKQRKDTSSDDKTKTQAKSVFDQELLQILFISSSGSIDENYLLLELSKKVNYSLIQTGINSYKIEIPKTSLRGNYLELPYLASQNFAGIKSVQASSDKLGVSLFIKTEPGYNLISIPDLRGIKISTEKLLDFIE